MPDGGRQIRVGKIVRPAIVGGSSGARVPTPSPAPTPANPTGKPAPSGGANSSGKVIRTIIRPRVLIPEPR